MANTISIGRIQQQAEQLLAAFAAAVPAAPARRYITQTIPAVDCEQLVLQVVQISHNVGNVAVEGGWGGPQLPSMTMPHAIYALWIHRCVPVIDESAPTADEEAASGALILADASAAWKVLLDVEGGIIPQRGLYISRWEALANEGGYGGGVLQFTASLAELRALP